MCVCVCDRERQRDRETERERAVAAAIQAVESNKGGVGYAFSSSACLFSFFKSHWLQMYINRHSYTTQ